ncbi:hypothetical protein LXL04_037911 [Taraxacum kok-saghyz]
MDPYFNHLKLLRTISALYVFVTVTFTRSPLTHDEECSALFQFKQSIIFQEDRGGYASWFRTFHSWKPTRNASDIGFDCCLWDGVECNNGDEFAHVIGLDLSGSFLCGHINSTSTLFSLVHLQRLSLAMNDFYHSQIPFEISRLQRLESLNLSASSFSGQIANEISQLMHLSSLDLSWNLLKLQSPNGLKHLVQNLTRLEELHLSGYDINSSVPQLLANFTSLRSIMLRSCLLQGKFPSVILELPKLKILDLSFNSDLTGSFPEFHNNNLDEYVNLAYTNFFGIVPISIRNLNNLKVLYLSGCFFSGRIGGSLSNLTQLTFLGLGGNKFKGLFPSLESFSKINVLELSGVEFETRRLPSWLSMMTKLSELYVYDMNLNGKVPAFLANLTKLSVVTMGRNSLSGQIPSSLFNLTQLRMLNFERNQLQGPISNSFSKFRSLQDLRLNYNNFSGKVDLDIFLGLNKLETLALGYNRISLVDTKNYTRNTLAQLENLDVQSCNLKEFPVFLRFQNKMKSLFLSNNKISGLVPVWIWNNSQETLQVIQLTNNHITGLDQHPHILPWRHLEGFFIGYNQIQGQLPIPPRTTYAYDVSNNNLTGDIPPSICEVKSLRVLDLSSNNIGGTLPTCFGSLFWSKITQVKSDQIE